MFNPEDFLNATVDPLATQFEVCPDGEYPFVIDSDPAGLKPREVKWNDKQTGEPRSFFQLELPCVCLDEAVKAKLGREKVVVRLRINLDLDSSGRLETGPNKNVGLGRLRDALRQNVPGWTPAQLLGAGPFIGKVEGTEGKDGRRYADIVRVAPLTR